MAEYLKEIIKLTSEQLTILSKDGSLKIGDKTYLYEPLTTIYLTPDTTQDCFAPMCLVS